MKTFTLSIAVASLALAAVAAPALAKPGGGDRSAMMAERMAEMDTNKDGKISKAEAEAVRLKSFNAMDADRNGVVSTAEMKAARQAIMAQQNRKMRGMDRLDANDDGQITKAEALAAPYGMFDRLDVNKDGVVDQSEMPKGGRT